jgi:hydrogenase small subunit
MEQTNKQNETYLQSIERKGYSRRDFMKFVAFIGAYMGVESTALGQVAKSLATTPRLPVIWEHFQECTCCSESFIRSDHPIVADIILDKISLDYTLTLMAASGHQAEAAKKSTMEKYKGEYILCVEGSVPLGDDGNYCVIAGRTAIDILKESAAGAKAIIAGEVVLHQVVFKLLNLILPTQFLLIKLLQINLLLMYLVVHQLVK